MQAENAGCKARREYLLPTAMGAPLQSHLSSHKARQNYMMFLYTGESEAQTPISTECLVPE